ncbi:MAG: MarR family transcriptional regulator [Alphaproteobacteria bacterium]|nr:MAG: MarR family transcriptional regulator [Alphaproteobacteria bacterium]
MNKNEKMNAQMPEQAVRGVRKSRREVDISGLEGLLGYNLRRAQMVELQRFASYFGPYDIRPVQYAILTLVDSNPGLNQSQLGEALDVKRANMVTLINELEGRGLVGRMPSARDRRSHTLELTEKGHALVGTLRDVQAKLEGDLMRQVGADNCDQLLDLLKKLRDS